MFLAEANATLLTLLGIVFVFNAIVLIVFVLFRQSDTGGVGAAFGGGDGGGAAAPAATFSDGRAV